VRGSDSDNIAPKLCYLYISYILKQLWIIVSGTCVYQLFCVGQNCTTPREPTCATWSPHNNLTCQGQVSARYKTITRSCYLYCRN